MPHVDLSDRLLQSIPSEDGQNLFQKTLTDQLAAGKSETVSHALAWSALQDAGYEANDAGEWVNKASGAKPVYLKREVLNAERLHEWAAEQGFQTALKPDDMHVTVIYSKDPFSKDLTARAEDDYELDSDWDNVVIRGGHRSVERLGKNGEAVVLRVESATLASENAMYRAMGASSGYPDYKPHITITWNAGDMDVSEVVPFDGDIVLGAIKAKLLDENWKGGVEEVALTKDIDKRLFDDDSFTMPDEARARSMELGLDGEIHVQQQLGQQAVYMPGKSHYDYISAIERIANIDQKEASQEKGLLERAISAIISTIMADTKINKTAEDAKILKLDDEQRIVWGWAYVSTKNGKLLTDTQGDSIEPCEMEKMANDFMAGERTGKTMHVGETKGTIIHSMPLTSELMKAFDIKSDREGWIIAYKVHDDETWNLVKSGDFRGFSIGGKAAEVEEY